MQQIQINNMIFKCYHDSTMDGYGARTRPKKPLMSEIDRERYFEGIRAQAEISGKQLHLLHHEGIIKYLIQI